MSKRINIGVILAILLLLATSAVYAQQRGEIHGAVYEDVNGDGLCFDTGVAGEGPVENIELEFVSSDEAVIINLVTGTDGTYGLVAAGQSVWRVTANPDSTKWVVTSKKTLYAPVVPETLVQTDINFCVQKVGTVTTGADGTIIIPGGNAVIILPESGAAKDTTSIWLIAGVLTGLGFVGFGVLLELRRRS